jgi:uncharacterized membrane protein
MSTTTHTLLGATTHQPPAVHLAIVAVLFVVVIAVLLVRWIRERRAHSRPTDQPPSE